MVPPLSDACECRAEEAKGDSCAGCVELALNEWAAGRPVVEVPSKWWRKFTPWRSCGRGYVLFGRSDLTGAHSPPPDGPGHPFTEHDIVLSCEDGVTIEAPPFDFETPWEKRVTFDLDHLKGAELDGFLEILRLARLDHLAIRDLNTSGQLDELAHAVSLRRRPR